MALSKRRVGPEEDRTRFLRLGLVIIDELTPILRDLLHDEIQPHDILNHLRKKGFKNLGAHQWRIIRTAETEGYKNFDISLTYTLLRNICSNIKSPTQNWGVSEIPSQNEITVGDDIERIRHIRNNVLCHMSKAAIPEKEFQNYLSIVSDICSRMQTRLKKDYVKMLQETKECIMDSNAVSKYMESIKKQADEEKTTKDLVQKSLAEKGLISKENIEIDCKDANQGSLGETLIDLSIFILNEMVTKVHILTPESDIDKLYESIEEFLKVNKEEIKHLDLQTFFEKLKDEITSYAGRQTGNELKILAKFLEFTLKLKRLYGAFVESSKGSLVLLMMFDSKRGYDHYKKDFESGEIGKQILQLFLYPPFLERFGLKVENIVVHLNGRLLTPETTGAQSLAINKSLVMDIQKNLQDVKCCHLCENSVPSKYCDICHMHLCESCVENHLSDKSKEHNIVPHNVEEIAPKCQIHLTETCTELCKQCAIPICPFCVASDEHYQHETENIAKWFENQKELLRKDLHDLEECIYPKYHEVVTNIPLQRDNVEKHTQKLTTDLNKQGEALHKEIDTIIQNMQSKVIGMKDELLTAIKKQEDSINHSITEIKQIIEELKTLLHSNDAHLVSKYKSRNDEFRSLPGQLRVTLPNFTPQKINKDQISQQVGYLPKLDILTYPAIPLLDDPKILTDIQTNYEINNKLRGVSCLSDTMLWTCGGDKFIRLYNLQGELMKSVETKSENVPTDIAMSPSGKLVYSDYHDRSINLVSDKQIKTLIQLQKWRPRGVCTTSSGDLLVSMDSVDEKHTKVERYSGKKAIKSIQYDDQGQPLYASNGIHYLSENRNLDICVADNCASAVVVVSASGKFRFKYTGHPSAKKRSFDPLGITTDSQGRILTTDFKNHRIHVVDEDGSFLRFIEHISVCDPWCLCVDSRSNLFVSDCSTGKVTKIQIYK